MHPSAFAVSSTYTSLVANAAWRTPKLSAGGEACHGPTETPCVRKDISQVRRLEVSARV